MLNFKILFFPKFKSLRKTYFRSTKHVAQLDRLYCPVNTRIAVLRLIMILVIHLVFFIFPNSSLPETINTKTDGSEPLYV